MSLIRKIKDNFKMDYYLLSSKNVESIERIFFLFRKYFCILTNRRRIKYLGDYFYYDNRFSPAMLEGYAKEIENINKAVDFSKIKSVLDIGANIGQFSYTLKKIYPLINVYSFEPNKEIFPILKKNFSNIPGIKIYNLGIGKRNEKRIFYFSPNSSPAGSFYIENMYQNNIRKNIRETKVDIVNIDPRIIKKLGFPKKFDFVKIDVEGAEMEVLESLKKIQFDYVYIEVSIDKNKNVDANLEVIKRILEKERGKAKLVYYELPNKDSPCVNVIFSFKPKN
jgi:FkbM family methyltransferase